MTKSQPLTAVQGKAGYVATIADALAPDSVGTGQKRFLTVETLNAGNLEKKNVLVFKKGTNPITHLNVV